MQTRRAFLESSALLLASMTLAPGVLRASPFGLPLGLQLYSVRDLLPKDYEGTLRQIAALGYTEVEAAGFYQHSAKDVKSAMQTAGLRCVSAHYPSAEMHARLDEIIAFHNELGAKYIICSSPGHKAGGDPHEPLDINDWRWNADEFNKMGAKVKAAGLQFGYHNHIAEFHKQDNLVPYDELIRLTDPALVTFEMDCGWVTVGGGDPVDYLQKHATRISMLHVKDFQRSDQPPSLAAPPKSAELGRGTADYKKIFHAANKANIKHYFVEQEEFDMPPFEALKIDADYMKKLSV